MNFQEFIQASKDHGVILRVTETGTIRDETGRCPVCALARKLFGKEYHNGQVVQAAERMELNWMIRIRIMQASDDPGNTSRERKTLLTLVQTKE